MSKVVDGILKDLKNIPESLRKKMKGTDKNKLIRMSIPYVIVGYFCDKSAWMFRQVEGDLFPRLMDTASRLGEAFANPLPSFNPMDLLFGVACGVGFRLIVYFKAKNAKKFRHGVEYGSARWGNAKDIEPYMDPVFENNIILTASERLMMSGRPSSPKYARNKNILVIGGSGSGKTRFFVKPNLMQMHSSYVVTDPKGYNVLRQTRRNDAACRNNLPKGASTTWQQRRTRSPPYMSDCPVTMSSRVRATA